MLTTRTGSFPIGFRRGWSEWQKDLPGLIAWAKENNVGVIDNGQQGAAETKAIIEGGLHIGSCDMVAWGGLISADKATRADAVVQNIEFITANSAAGARRYFIVLLPENAELSRKENFGYAVDSLNALSPTLEKVGGQVVIEGWPGPGALSCTPEGYRAILKECPSKGIGVNFDPSHLIRMGIDYLRFVDEFAPRVGHVHGKDTEILSDNVYEYGTELPATFAPRMDFGAYSWRYTIPGHGVASWTRIFKTLEGVKYDGAVSIELEDEAFNGTDDGEKRGILLGAQFLAGC